jgi:hypothetical protein
MAELVCKESAQNSCALLLFTDCQWALCVFNNGTKKRKLQFCVMSEPAGCIPLILTRGAAGLSCLTACRAD